MEDIPRDIQRDLARIQNTPAPKHRRQWTLMFVGATGEVVTFRRYKVWLFFYMTLLVGAVSAAGIFWFLSRDSLDENRRLRRETKALEKQLAAVKAEKELMMARMVLTASIHRETGTKSSAPAAPPAMTASATAGETAQPPPPEQTISADSPPQKKRQASMAPPDTKAATTEAVKMPLVDVENLKVTINHSDQTIHARFTLKKVTVDGESISGRTFVILRGESDAGHQWLVIPSVSLENGRPSRVRSGRFFSIARFNIVQFNAALNIKGDTISGATVLVYSLKGEPLLEKHFDIHLKIDPA